MKKRLFGFIGIITAILAATFIYGGVKAQAASDEHVLDNGLVVTYYSNGETADAQVVGYVGDKGDVVIPEYIGQHVVYAIGESAFEDNKVIQSVVIPQSVSRISKKAFKNCVNLKSVIFEGNHLDWLEDHNKLSMPMYVLEEAFYGCASLEYIEFTHGFNLMNNSKEKQATIFAGSGLKTAKVNVCDGWCDLGGIFNNCANLEKIDVDFAGIDGKSMGGSTGHVTLSLISDIPNLKEINLYNLDKIRLLTDISYNDSNKDGAYDSAITNCPKLETINMYFNEPGNGACVLARGCALTSSDMLVVETGKTPGSASNPDDYGYNIKVVGNGTATISSDNGMIDYVFNVIVGDGIGNKKDVKNASVELPVNSFGYTGDEIVPYASLTYEGTVLEEDKDYTVTCTNNTDIGTAKLTFTGKGEYAGSIEAQFSIIPETVAIKSIKSSKSKYTVIWNKNPQATGYEIRYSTKKSSGYKKLTATTKLTVTSDKLKSGMYIKIRTYKTVDGKKLYSEYSKPIKIK